MTRELGSLGRSTGFISLTRKWQLKRYTGKVRCYDPHCSHPEIRVNELVFIRVRSGRARHYYCIPCALAGNHLTPSELREVLSRVPYVRCLTQPCIDLIYTNVIDQVEMLGLVVTE